MADDYSGNNPYPYGAGFPLSQYQNPYSLYNGQPMPWPSQYGGTPTNAFGQPIQSFLQAQAAAQAAPPPAAAATPGTSLNTSAANPAGGVPPGYAGGLNLTPQQAQQRYYGNMANQDVQAGLSGMVNGRGGNAALGAAMGNLAQQNYAMAQAPQQAAPAAAPSGFNSRAAALQALANPGHVATPGADVPYNQGAVSTGPGVLQQFLQNWKASGAPTRGAGNYNNAGFFNTLQGMAARPAAGG